MNKYRFKTEEEFKTEGLWIKDHPNTWNSSGCMNKYLGQDIPEEYNTKCDNNKPFNMNDWAFTRDAYVLKESSFVLPEKWCIKLTEENIDTLGKWRSAGPLLSREYSEEGWYLHTPKHGAKGYNEPVRDPDYTEITFEQFKQHVLKESPVVETTKEIDMKDIQEEAKKRFPIGCKFIPANSANAYTLIEDSYTYTIHSKQIYAHKGHGTLYNNGEWATLVSLPEPVSINEFKEGDYIVTLDVATKTACARNNFCFKQKENAYSIKPLLDLYGDSYNANTSLTFDKLNNLKDWRYATPEEIAEYDRIGKPYDVTTLQKKKESIPEYVECISYFADKFTGKIYNTKIDTPEKSSSLSWKEILIEHNRLEDGSFKPSTKEAYDDQYAPKKLKKEDLVKGEIYIYDGSQISTYPEGPSISIDEQRYTSNPKWMWRLSITHATEEQKALLKGEIEKRTAKTFKSEYIPQVGDYVVMENAGGWGYHPDNNGCIAIVEKVSTNEVGFGSDSIIVRSIGGQIINAKRLSHVTFNNVPIIDHEKQLVFRKALPHEIPSDLPKKTVIEEWSEGTYAVGVKGNFGVYTKADNLVPVGRIFTIKENREENTLVVKDHAFWIYKKNLKWFATYEEALNFSNQLKASPPPMWSSDPIVEQKISTPSIKKETFIDNVQSVDVMLRTKRKSIKF